MEIKCVDDLVVAQFERICNAADRAMYSSQKRVKLMGTGRFRLLFEKGQVSLIEQKSLVEKNKHLYSVLNHAPEGATGNTVAISREDLNDLGMNLIEVATRIDLSALCSGCLSDSEWPRLTESVERLRRSKAYLVSCTGLTTSEVCAICKDLAGKHGSIERVLIDSSCLTMESQTGMSRTLRDRAKPKIFDDLAALLGCSVVLFSVVQIGLE